jgi:transcriptional repressor NF-X1
VGSAELMSKFLMLCLSRPFDCRLHFCSKHCHPPSYTPPPCPRSPSQMTHCPCKKHELSPSSISFFPPNTLLPRTKCTDPIPSCDSTCMKPLSECQHVCSSRCHTGPCPPCTIMLVRPCRCGAATKDVRCSSLKECGNDEILCDRICTALRACGRHQCNRVCCPLASLAAAGRGRGKKRGVVDQTRVDEMGLHECDLICGKLLGCGNHRCEETDHRGACPPCLRSGFDEVSFFFFLSPCTVLRLMSILISR